MADKILNTRILLKHATLNEWNSSSLILKKGEVAFATVPTAEGSTLEPIMFKVGDGTKTFAQLDWASAKAADVYGWAKAAGLPIDATKASEGQFIEGFAWESNKLVPKFRGFITEINEANKDKLDAPTTKAVKNYVDSEVQKAVSGGVEGLATEQYVDDAITALSAEGGAIKAVADNLVAHEQAFEEFKTANTQAITDAVAAEAEIARAAEKANADAIDAIEADYLKAADLNDYAKTADVPNIKVNNAGTADKVANALTVGSKTYDGSTAIEVTASDLGLESAMHFIGALSAAPDTAKPGDVYLNTATKKEYVYDTTNGWVELGDEGSYALRTVTITGTDGLTGGGDLSENRTIGLSEDTKASLTKANTAIQKVETGVTNGTVKVDGAEVSVAGLGSAAYTNSDAYDAAGTAQGLVDTLGTMAKESKDNYYTKTEADSAFMNSTEVDTAISTELAKHAGIDKVGTVTSVGVGEGFKNSGTATDPIIDIIQKDEEGAVTWILDCGGAE